MGSSVLRKIQIVREDTAGTNKAADTRLLGKLDFKEELVLHRQEDERASLAIHHRTDKVGEKVPMSFEGTCTFQHILHFLEMGVHVETPSAGPTAGDYTWTYDPTLTAEQTIKTYSFEYGDNDTALECDYVFVKSIEISGSMDAPWMIKVELMGRNMQATSFAGGLSDDTVESILTNKTVLSIDSAGTNPGTTDKDATLLAFTWKLDTGLTEMVHGGSDLYYDDVKQKGFTVSCDMTLDYNTIAEAQRVLYAAGTQQTFQLKGTGSEIGGGVYNAATLQFAGVYTAFGGLKDQDGASVVDLTVEGQYDATWSKLFTVIVVNEVSTL